MNQVFEGFHYLSDDPIEIREIRDYDTSKLSSRFEIDAQIEWSDWGTYTEENGEEIYLKYFTTGIIRKMTVRDVFLEINGKYCCMDKRDLLRDVVDPVLKEKIRANIENPQLVQNGSAKKIAIQAAKPPARTAGKEVLGAYRLVDPRNEETFYIGISKNMQRRYKQHLACCGLNYEKNIRIQSILKDGLLPRMDTIEEEILQHNAKDRERHWIQRYRDLGAPLTNIAEMDGGE
jgi:GIY-YIG catalytic domain.